MKGEAHGCGCCLLALVACAAFWLWLALLCGA